MSKAALIVILVAVLVVIGGIVWYVMAFPDTFQNLMQQPPATTQNTENQNQPPVKVPLGSGLPTPDSDTSDAALAKDVNAIDAQMKNFGADASGLDTSVSNAPK